MTRWQAFGKTAERAAGDDSGAVPKVVTGLTQDHRAPDHLLVEIDGARYASLLIDLVHELDLRVGWALAPQQFAQLERQAAIEAARDVAIRLLAVRPRSVNEMRRRLRERGHDSNAVDAAVDRLSSVGLLNDEHYAAHFARVRAAKGHAGPRLVADLKARGVDRRVAESAVHETLDAEGIDTVAQARDVAERRAKQLKDVPPEAARRRLLAYMTRRGFRGHEIFDLVRELIPK
jgi:regulatory protein